MKKDWRMGAHVSSRQSIRTIYRSGMFVRASQNHLEVTFGPFAKAWPLVWKRATLAGMRPEVRQGKKPKLLIQTSLQAFLELMKPRTQKREASWSKIVSLIAGVAVIVIAFSLPMKAPQTRAQKPTVKADLCSLARLKKVVAGDIEAPDIEFTKAESFSGVTSGVLTCKGARYSYTLESKGLERVLKVGKLDS